MQYYFSPTHDLATFKHGLAQLESDPTVLSVLIFSCDKNDYPLPQINTVLQNFSKPLMGGVFPQIIYQTQAYKTGCLLVGLPYALNVERFEGLSDKNTPFADQIEHAFLGVETPHTVLVLVDGLAKCISGVVDGLFDVLGAESNFVGGGAGSLSFVQKPCLFSNDGMFADVALVGFLQASSRVGVGHGWSTIDSDHQITRVDKNIIYKIDHRNAFEVYQEVVNRYSATPILKENFFEVAQAFPFGINKRCSEKVVRDPIAVTECGALICVGELALNDFIDILSALPEQLIAAAANTAQLAFEMPAEQPPQGILLIDCISRALFLQKNFSQELEAIALATAQQSPTPLTQFGALALGEIANSGGGYLEFYNKTTVVAVF
ncbi:FIST signal transduction protein [Thiomicrorhabdus aquaedulcis]|uniref:FIST signal transduction protein n=1 Tax=Thiomicrorhabdus aquaedulcis TaxID=2211106 RepID=UPI000FD97A11|nr:FIST N-terminal domain-containing protein [Thiomicrorhabdus aquaedulcis]